MPRHCEGRYMAPYEDCAGCPAIYLEGDKFKCRLITGEWTDDHPAMRRREKDVWEMACL